MDSSAGLLPRNRQVLKTTSRIRSTTETGMLRPIMTFSEPSPTDFCAKPNHTVSTALPHKMKLKTKNLKTSVPAYPLFAEMDNANIYFGDWVEVARWARPRNIFRNFGRSWLSVSSLCAQPSVSVLHLRKKQRKMWLHDFSEHKATLENTSNPFTIKSNRENQQILTFSRQKYTTFDKCLQGFFW